MGTTPSIVPQPRAAETSLRYANDVISGTIIACKYVIASCKRFLKDHQAASSDPSCPYYFDEAAAQHAIDFFGFLRHTKGVWAKKIETAGFVLAPWQVFVITNLYGFIVKSTGERRFREAHLEVARKNGKSTFIAGIGLYMLTADGEPGAEVYSAATTKDQAKIVFKESYNMVTVSPFLSSRIGRWRNNLHVDSTFSKYEPLTADPSTHDGLNIHCALIDELHEHPSRALYDVLNTATGSRSQPLIMAITTAGFNREGICWDQRTYGIKVLTGVIPDDNFFAFIATLDEGDDWKDTKNWIKANPNLGVSTSIERIMPNFQKALEQPAAQNEFLRKHLNVWTSAETAWLPDGCWEKNTLLTETDNPQEAIARAIEGLKGRRCFGGLDLAETDDLNSLALVFPPCEQVNDIQVPNGMRCIHVHGTDETKLVPSTNADPLLRIGAATEKFGLDIPENLRKTVIRQAKDELWRILVWYWIPDAYVDEKSKKNRAPYDAWVRMNYIKATPGQAVNQEVIRSKVLELNSQFRITEIGYDQWNTGWIGPKLLEDGVKMVKIPQRFEFLSAPTKTFTAYLVAAMKLPTMVEHYNNPVMRWNASNVQLLLDSNGNQRPDKEHSRNKIDGVVATVMAFNRVLANPLHAKADDPDRYKVRTIPNGGS